MANATAKDIDLAVPRCSLLTQATEDGEAQRSLRPLSNDSFGSLGDMRA